MEYRICEVARPMYHLSFLLWAPPQSVISVLGVYMCMRMHHHQLGLVGQARGQPQHGRMIVVVVVVVFVVVVLLLMILTF